MPLQGRATSTVTVPTPTTRAELEILWQRRSELRDQLSSLTERHSQLVGERYNAQVNQNQTVVAELDARIAEHSSRISRVEREKLLTDDAISAGIANGLGAQETVSDLPQVISIPSPNISVDVPGQYGVQFGEREFVAGALTVLLLGVFAWRWAWRRAERRVLAVIPPGESQQTKDLRVAVETIALEVERISEGQRFITKLLAERAQKDPALLERAKPEP